MALFKKEFKETQKPNFELKLPDFPEPPTLPKPPNYEKIISPQIIERYTPRAIPKPVTKPTIKTPLETEEKPLFVKINRYERVVSSITEIKRKLNQTRDILSEIKAIKDQEDAKLQEWYDSLEEVKEKILRVDQILAESLK